MNKRIGAGLVFFLSFLMFSTIALGINKRVDDPNNDVIVVKNFQYTFDWDTSSIEDLDIIENIEYYHTSEKPGLDLEEVDIDKEGDKTEITFEVKQEIKEYPYTGRNTFFVGIIILENNHEGMGAIHVENSFIELNKYGQYYSNDLSGIKDFDYSHIANKIKFIIPSSAFPSVAGELYAVIGEADLENVDIENIKFTISNLRLDLYPNSLYGAKDTNFPDNEDIDDTTSDADSTNPYMIGLVGVIALVSIITIPSIFNKKK
jgi:hypothetical protein